MSLSRLRTDLFSAILELRNSISFKKLISKSLTMLTENNQAAKNKNGIVCKNERNLDLLLFLHFQHLHKKNKLQIKICKVS